MAELVLHDHAGPASLERAYAAAHAPEAGPLPLPEELRDHAPAGFLELIAPLIHERLARIREEAVRLQQIQRDCPFDPHQVGAQLFADLPLWLLMMVSRTMVLELQAARLLGELEGDTPDARFQSFVRGLRRPERALALLQEYPVLAQRVTAFLDNWAAFSLELLQQLCDDWDALRATFSPDAEPGHVTQLRLGAGDHHRRGRSVAIVAFSSGLRVVYKPKSLAIEQHFQELLAWLNARGSHTPLRTLKTLDRSTHGWIEFVEARSCVSQADVQRFYQRQGAYLALLYALEATDFHYENIIAAGEHPVLIDLESLFQARIDSIGAARESEWISAALDHSVLRTGLLPQWAWVSEEFAGIDVSGLSNVSGQLNPHALPVWDKVGTDEMRVTRRRVELSGGKNRPRLGDAEVQVLDYSEDLLGGFRAMYRLLLERRDELLAADGPLARCAGDEVRVILRPTRIYALLLQEGFHPDALRDPLDQELLLDRLSVAVEQQPYLPQVIPYERAALWQGDIPMFTTRPDSLDLWSDTGARIDGFFQTSGLESVARRIGQFNADDLDRQVWFIRAALTALTLDIDSMQYPSYAPPETPHAATRANLLDAACAVANQLERLALRSNGRVAWVGLTLINEVHWSPAPLGLDLYSGLPGVALFLAYLGQISGEVRYAELARETAQTMLGALRDKPSALPGIGAFTGLGGVIYTLTHLGALWQEPYWLTQAEELAARLPELIARDRELDVLGGAAGCIGALLALYDYQPSRWPLAMAMHCGDHLLATAQPMPYGLAWSRRDGLEQPLTGFSHGAAGMAWALLELSAVSRKQRYRETALGALAYERSLFAPERGNWPDLRELPEPLPAGANGPRFMTAWCHGAPGIGMARLRMLAHLDDPQLIAEATTALQTMLARGFNTNHSLCHGDLGNLELLLQAGQTLPDPQWQAELERASGLVLASIAQHGWLCGVPHGVETPGLMTGLAGIGYGLLRLAAPRQVPSVLLLEPPLKG